MMDKWNAFNLEVVGFSLIACGLLTTAFSDNRIESLTYGDLFLMESKHSNLHHLDLSLEYGTELNNPYYQIKSLSMDGQYWLTENITLSINPSFYQHSLTPLQESIEGSLLTYHSEVTYFYPEWSLYTAAGYRFVHGLVNGLGKSVLSYDLLFGVGVGLTSYRPYFKAFGAEFFVKQNIEFTDLYGFSLFYNFYLEKSSQRGWIHRNKLGGGIYVKI